MWPFYTKIVKINIRDITACYFSIIIFKYGFIFFHFEFGLEYLGLKIVGIELIFVLKKLFLSCSLLILSTIFRFGVDFWTGFSGSCRVQHTSKDFNLCYIYKTAVLKIIYGSMIVNAVFIRKRCWVFRKLTKFPSQFFFFFLQKYSRGN